MWPWLRPMTAKRIFESRAEPLAGGFESRTPDTTTPAAALAEALIASLLLIIGPSFSWMRLIILVIKRKYRYRGIDNV